MSTKAKSMYDYLKEEASLDIEKMVEQAFSGAVGFRGFTVCVSDTATLRFRLMLGGQHPGPIDPILRTALVTQLQISQRFARLWTQDNPDLDELIEVWQEQTEATARWVLLQSLLESKTQLAEIEEAYHFALEQSPYEGVVESVNILFQRGVPLEEIKAEILKYLSRPIDNDLPSVLNLKNIFGNSESGIRETNTELIRSTFSKIVQEIRAEYPDIAHFPFEDQVEEVSLILLEQGDSVESVKQQILDYLKNLNRVDESHPQSNTLKKKPFAYDVEGQGYDEGYWDDESPTTEGILRRNLPQGPAPTPNEASEPETRIREARIDEIPGTWDELDGMVDDPRYVQETRNPETGEWENPVYLGTVNPNVDSWENIDRVKNVETGELYSDEEWAKLQERQSDQGRSNK